MVVSSTKVPLQGPLSQVESGWKAGNMAENDLCSSEPESWWPVCEPSKVTVQVLQHSCPVQELPAVRETGHNGKTVAATGSADMQWGGWLAAVLEGRARVMQEGGHLCCFCPFLPPSPQGGTHRDNL